MTNTEPVESAPGSHRRFDALRGRWVLVSAGRDRRPWSGQAEAVQPGLTVAHDPACPLCPGNLRGAGAGGGNGGDGDGVRNPDYTGPYVFANDFPALRPGAGQDQGDPSGRPVPQAGLPDALLHSEPVAGVCRVMCFGPRHDRHLAAMSDGELAAVIDTWTAQTRELAPRWRWVQIFENRGAAMGASNPHPHGQIWASSVLPDEPAAEDARQRAYLRQHGRRLLVDYAATEQAAGERVVAANDGWLAVVPYWAVWPFETMLLPLRPVASLADLDGPLRASLVDILRTLLTAYDHLFGVPFPYSMGWHGAPGPADSGPAADRSTGGEHWQLHAHFYPPLLRSATIRKFLVGFEMLAGPQRDITPEQAAARLRAHVPSPARAAPTAERAV
ncbi:UDP-glucose--hexose-1-phosphate uridylyltransferase [Frankia sp. CNm7]|uniref:Galactose-1-phosphate uridylyltransferase n=1 Tax=Frankia nepalensis TaxID=1836974 RepID=A0A937RP26_9ACTN|nr:UDP-glucose--hexose-1-phosphate uridylyltransferase [Frankia nepalensis]MBL7495099.1 UDP-glucose--hexose-1-phosphate uridylyltransferase [Frankia nepalensis]MBL7515372.1 UDP-glucose--hexose-1-phosphate uridylyltransferase [Frankia nepalensis]MBL7522240.1 UDP-glucose--hexose-1-phosphate uridylyltransferase [Frankia nepalensis]MBL7632329.1 UDP-glucose--hexose-1-phosphate uridylyltransferase [Frankia nepalensis]